MKISLSLLTLLSSFAFAQAQSFIANLDGTQDGGGGRMGTGIINLTLTGTTLSLSGSFSGLSGTFTADHIHGPGAPGVPAAVIYGLGGLTTVDAGGHSGSLSGTVDLIPLQSGAYTVAQQIADLDNGLWYINIHTSPNFGGGEIRGQILAVPEPSTWAVGALSLGMLALWRRKTCTVAS